MNDNDIRQRDIDSAAAFLTSGSTTSPGEWSAFAAGNHGRTRDVYRRCAELAQAVEELEVL